LVGSHPVLLEALLILLGGVTFTGSVVAFLKLAGRMSSKPIKIPGPRHFLNSSLLGLNVATMGTFLAMAPGSPIIAAACLSGNAILSFLKGYTTTAAIGGADMRTSFSVMSSKLLMFSSRRYHRTQCLLGICPRRRRLHAR
jgi:NAD(P) transhydrogenase